MARYKVLKSVAHSFAHSFTSLMNYSGDDYVMGHLLRRAEDIGEPALAVDVLTGKAEPGALLTRDVAQSVASYCAWFPKLVANHGTEMRFVQAARMVIRFNLEIKRPVRGEPRYFESPFKCRVEIADDRGRVWAAEIRDWWYPEASGPVGASRAGARTLVWRLGQAIRSVWGVVRLRDAAV